MEALVQEEPVSKRIVLAKGHGGLSFPLDIVTQSIAILAIRRAGKSVTARKLFEALVRAGLQAVTIDPKGDWWGVRFGADGKSPGLQVVVLGGEHGDLPLDPASGEEVAHYIVESLHSVILDLSLMRKHERVTFVIAFAETFFRLKAQEKFRTPVMLFDDEADQTIPQRTMERGPENRMLGAMQDLVARGGQRGIGFCLISQRSAVVNKNVLTQCQVLIALRTISPQDRKALDAWIEVHGSEEQRATLMESIASLPRGTAWVWSPGWPDDAGIFQRVAVDMIETFDSGATPKPGERPVVPKNGAEIDLEALGQRLTKAAEQKKATDPKLLQQRVGEQNRTIAQLQARIQKLEAAKAAAPAKGEMKVKERSVLKLGDLQSINIWVGRAEKAAAHITGAVEKLREKVARAQIEGSAPPPAPPIPARAPNPGRAPPAPQPLQRRANPAPAPSSDAPPRREQANGAAPTDAEVGRSGLRRMLIALAQRPQGLTNRQLGVRAGVSSRSGTFSTYLSRARSQGWIRDEGEIRFITPAGLAALGPYDPLPEGPALADYWIREMGESGASRMLRVLVDAGQGVEMDNDALGEAAGISARSGTFSTYLSRLRSLELVQGRGGALRAADELFAGGA